MVVAAAAVAAIPGGAQEQRVVCDADDDGMVSVKEAQGCAEQRFELVRGDAGRLAEEQFAAVLADAGALQRQFAEVDQDGDDRISRDEWLQWFGPAYAEAAKATQRQPDGTD
jgi:hypothetical protein